jgi:hypothetical protein
MPKFELLSKNANILNSFHICLLIYIFTDQSIQHALLIPAMLISKMAILYIR